MTGGFSFDTTWGANLLDEGLARFRLWAPGRERVRLVDGLANLARDMERREDGWFEIETGSIAPGEAYAFELGDGTVVPDPASRFQAVDVHGPSILVDPEDYEWRARDWRGRPWHETVIHEIHVGAFAGEGRFDDVRRRLDYLEGLGVTAIELMPVAQFAGVRGWGYDSVLLYAPHVAYGGPSALKALIDAAHERGLMVFLDVVYNHFGPEGCYLQLFAPAFFHKERRTPWGAAIAYDKEPVRRFFVENALYWIEEYRFDGLRFDAVDHMDDPSSDHILDEIARAVRERAGDRRIHLMTEDDRNDVRHLERDGGGRPLLFTAEWNDDFHHAAHVIATAESGRYYQDYAEESVPRLTRALSEGFIYQGEPSSYRNGAKRGAPSSHLPPTAFVSFLQNHDQIGNRALGERLTNLTPARAVETLLAILLLSPSIPLLYMGEEWGETRPFLFFCDFEGELAEAVRAGRRAELEKWPRFQDPCRRGLIPDPNAPATFEASRLDWDKQRENQHHDRLGFVRGLLILRAREIVPRLQDAPGGRSNHKANGSILAVSWLLGGGSRLSLAANLGGEPAPCEAGSGTVIFQWPPGACDALEAGALPAWSCVFLIEEGGP